MISDEEVVKDILQDVFVSLWSKTGLEINTSFSAYIYAAVRFQLFDYIDKQKVRQGYADSLQHFLDQGVYSTDNYLLEKELQQQIEKEIMNLPPKMREIFILSRQEEKSYEEIARQSNVSLNTVRKQVSNALKIMRSKFTSLFFTFLNSIYYFFHLNLHIAKKRIKPLLSWRPKTQKKFLNVTAKAPVPKRRNPG
ncbi:RNA polymerase sigma-70 factor [Sphingobacterium sp. E70]|nr:RNA polymerase sigma-70 factor [Sphingobacterium sp. E70]